MKALSKAKAGVDYTIKWLLGKQDTVNLLDFYDIRQGSTINLINRYHDGSVIIAHDNRRFVLSGDVAARIRV